MIHLIVLGVFLSIILLVIGFSMENFFFITIGGMFMGAVGINLYTDGILLLNNFLTQTLSTIFIAVGGYLSIVGGFESLREVT